MQICNISSWILYPHQHQHTPGGGGGVDSDLLKAAQMGRVRGTIKSQSAWGQGANEGLGSWLSLGLTRYTSMSLDFEHSCIKLVPVAYICDPSTIAAEMGRFLGPIGHPIRPISKLQAQ